ncbi:hypothetical protein HDU98_011121 [Podochytrium sp. JEL0797]|nr:hypothetical protein HDU98_011121 [Podochytrium sp. JEL0797]
MLDDKELEEGTPTDQFDGLDLTPDQIKVKLREIEMNKHIDEKLMANPDAMPKAVYFIIPNELGERFVYYGLAPVLKNFFQFQLGYIDNTQADMMYHIFQGLCYYTPILGALLSDSYLDKYKTIVILSCVYVAGLGLTTITSWPTIMGVETTHLGRVGPLLGLLCISFGTGGIKPCVSAHGGDQFLETQKYGLQKFYNYFYMAINVGSLVSSYVSPIIQQHDFFTTPNDTLAIWKEAGLSATGNGYPQSFLMLTCFMAFATSVFVFGRRWYRIVPPSGKFILTDIFTTAGVFLSNRFKMPSVEAYKKTCQETSEGMVVEMMDLAKVIGAIWPACIFWMGFNQNASTWQDMGNQMAIPFGGDKSTSFFGSQVTNNIWNPFFIIVIAPTFANLLYPYIDKRFGADKFGLMQRMVVGQFIAGFAFILAALIQRNVNANCHDGGPVDFCQSTTSITWEIGLYFVNTVAEVLFSISGLNFTYVEVGKSTKSLCASLWLFTSGTGSFLAVALMSATMGTGNPTWTRENFFYLVGALCMGSGIVQYVISRAYVPKSRRETACL